MASVKSFTFYLTYYDVAQELDPDSRGLFYNAVAEYMFANKDLEQELPFDAKVAFKCIKASLKLSKTRSKCGYEKKQINIKSKSNAKQKESKRETSNQEYKYSSNQGYKGSMSNSEQSKAPKFDRQSGASAEEGADSDAYDFEITDEELREMVQSWR